MQFPCDAVIFDLDGVLVDSSACIERHWRRWAAKHNLDADALVQVIHGRRPVEIIRSFAPHLHAEAEAAAIAAGEASDLQGVVPVEGAATLLQILPYQCWAVATSGTRAIATARLAHVGLPRPRVLVAADDVTHGKPNPEPYLRAADQLGVLPAWCVALEDAPAGVKAARAAGMRTLGIATTHDRAALAGADAVADRLLDVQITRRRAASSNASLIVHMSGRR